MNKISNLCNTCVIHDFYKNNNKNIRILCNTTVILHNNNNNNNTKIPCNTGVIQNDR